MHPRQWETHMQGFSCQANPWSQFNCALYYTLHRKCLRIRTCKSLINRFIISVFFPRPPLCNGRLGSMLSCVRGENSDATDYDLRHLRRFRGRILTFFSVLFVLLLCEWRLRWFLNGAMKKRVCNYDGNADIDMTGFWIRSWMIFDWWFVDLIFCISVCIICVEIKCTNGVY